MEIPQGKLVCEDLVIDGITVSRAGHRIKLSSNEFWLLVYLVHNKNRVVTRRMIEEHSWAHANREKLTNAVDVYICYLRSKIDKGFDKKLLHTVRGFGYLIGNAAALDHVGVV
jgi:DNA-binding response OmpR family regulator